MIKNEEIVTKSDVRQYFISNEKDEDGFHIVYREGCEDIPADHTKIGQHHTCEPAMRKARDMGFNPRGSVDCCPDCNPKV